MRAEIATVVLAAMLIATPMTTAGSPPRQGSPDSSGDLAALEQRLAGDPDNLEAGNQYRQVVIRARQHDRCLTFFERLVANHPDAANAYLNYGFAYVDKIPSVGAITQVILANNALTAFTHAVEVRPNWLAYYTRGNSYLFWPTVLGRAPLGIADLERALELQRRDTLRSYHVRTFIALGDGYWRLHQPERARQRWSEGAGLFPANAALKTRLSSKDDSLDTLVADAFDPSRRVDTDLQELWAQR